jgi:hypothetical protein
MPIKSTSNHSFASEHLIIIIDKLGKIPPKKYACGFSERSKEDAIKLAKKQYETKHDNYVYDFYYFEHESTTKTFMVNNDIKIINPTPLPVKDIIESKDKNPWGF